MSATADRLPPETVRARIQVLFLARDLGIPEIKRRIGSQIPMRA